MIEGLKVTLDGTKLRGLANDRAAHHEERVETYAAQIASMKASRVEGMAGMSNGDPIVALDARRVQHENDARELRFIAENLDASETYLLDRDALSRLGIVASRY